MNYSTYAWIGLIGNSFYIIGFVLLLSLIPNSELLFISAILNLFSYIAGAFFLYAFIDISSKLKKKVLLIGSTSLFIFALLLAFLDLLAFPEFFDLFYTLPFYPYFLPVFIKYPSIFYSIFPLDTTMVLVILGILIILVGVFTLISGIGFLKLKERFGGLATATGVLDIITGASLITLILSFIGVFTMIASFVLKTIILFKADKILK